MYSKLAEKQNLTKVAELLNIFLRTPDEVEKHVSTGTCNFMSLRVRKVLLALSLSSSLSLPFAGKTQCFDHLVLIQLCN